MSLLETATKRLLAAWLTADPRTYASLEILTSEMLAATTAGASVPRPHVGKKEQARAQDAENMLPSSIMHEEYA
ncbi:hypothetical protein QFC21_006061 [Naganishia friedmannii]|uniref:Uncharacterized protein n=1 Tax=Naganishia friedmannii TaxID=89922 RepID=A0ACC2V555_9TREE|nr:hypothetical protein QFC21_006061 [Naganishia friedmannii]